MRQTGLGIAVTLTILAGCSSNPPGEVITETTFDGQTVGVGPIDASGDVPSDTVILDRGGLVERLPNTCKLENYQQYIGQSAVALTNDAFDRPWRVVSPDTIVSQEYDPSRLNFYTNSFGTIQRISCG